MDFMNYKSEKIAQFYLEWIGWDVKKETSNKYKRGFPDIHNNKEKNQWCEVKMGTASKKEYVGFSMSYYQLKRWQKLIENGDKVFILILSGKLDILKFLEIVNKEVTLKLIETVKVSFSDNGENLHFAVIQKGL